MQNLELILEKSKTIWFIIYNSRCFYLGAGEASADVPEGEENKAKNDNPAVEGISSYFILVFIIMIILKFHINN